MKQYKVTVNFTVDVKDLADTNAIIDDFWQNLSDYTNLHDENSSFELVDDEYFIGEHSSTGLSDEWGNR